MRTDIRHIESWHVSIRLDDDDRADGFSPWPPVLDLSHAYRGGPIEPVKVMIEMFRGHDGAYVTAHGPRILKNGRPGKSEGRVSLAYGSASDNGVTPEWVAELVRKVREDNDLTPEKTGVPW